MAYLLHKISDAYQLETRLSLVTQQSELQLRAYKDLADKYALSRRTIHDVKKHIATMQSLIDKNQIEVAEKYKGMMNAELDKLTPEFMCDNDFLLISVKNSFNQVDEITNGIYKTTKKWHQGVGLTNVKNAIIKYDGVFSTSIENTIFLSEITLCIPS